jgi:hypothetical protein
MYVILAYATCVLVAVVALTIGFGLCVAGLLMWGAVNRGLKILFSTNQAESQIVRRVQSYVPHSAVAQPIPMPAVSLPSLRRVLRHHAETV